MALSSLIPSSWTAWLPPAMPWTPEHHSSNIILRVENKFRVIQRPPTYADALNAVYAHFPCMKSHAVVRLSTSFDNIWPDGDSAFSPVTSDTWRFIGPNVSILFAEAEPEPRQYATRPNTHQLISASSMIPIWDRLGSQTFKADEVESRVTFTMQPSRGSSLRGRGQGRGKPVIYLFPPSPLRASVTLSLSRSWVFDAVYPATKTKENLEGNAYPQTVQWEVDAGPGGDLVERATDLQVSYLFWEARRANRSTTVQECPPTSFDPDLGACTPFNSVVLEHADLLKYLDTSLKALGLHTEARTSFITYWLPAFQKHSFIALRFVPQSAFEIAAPLAIEPKPDVVTRVFMLFKGLPDLQDGQWTQAVERADEDVARWKDIAGVDSDKQANPSLFRVLEWGGTEIDD